MAKMKKENIIKNIKHYLDEYCEGYNNNNKQKMADYKITADYFCWSHKVDERLTIDDYNELKEYRDSLLVKGGEDE